MSITAAVIGAAERLTLPDGVLRAVVKLLVGRTKRRLRGEHTAVEQDFARRMADCPIAINTREANDQHYELPAEFFGLMLGPQRKYSCCYYPRPDASLADAEECALAQTAEHAALADGQLILELGCGWGSLSLWMARKYPRARIVAVSNSQSQRAFVTSEAKSEGLQNLTVITADINAFAPAGQFDRVVSVEMFEHMSNWRELLRRTSSWLAPQGTLFVHIFVHAHAPYRFDAGNPADWIARYFFTGGIMPSRGLMRQFDDLVAIEGEWLWNGNHYRRTAE
jgi:cyclopropane-fatty-acyl-phospholipid synthase